MLKIYDVSFNDGGWHQSLPSYKIVAESKEKAIEMVLEKYPQYLSHDKWASEFKLDGYVIEVYDEKTYQRDKNLKSLDI